MTTIKAETILSSQLIEFPERILYTFRLTYPRCIHAEFMTHRMLSRNASSSRAIPVERLIQAVLDDPFVPLFWGKNQKGMQDAGECAEPVRVRGMVLPNTEAWLHARDEAVSMAKAFSSAGYHKQIVNRLLEPWMHITVVVSGTEWSNFLALRDHPDAEPHIQMLAREIRRELEKQPMQKLRPGDWHLPFVTQEEWDVSPVLEDIRWVDDLLKLSVARCASTSYNTVEGYEMTLERATALHDRLVKHKPMHASPLEHVAQADGPMLPSGGGWAHEDQHRNFRGFRQYRAMLPGESA